MIFYFQFLDIQHAFNEFVSIVSILTRLSPQHSQRHCAHIFFFFRRTVNQRRSLTQCQRVEASNQMNICDISRRELKLDPVIGLLHVFDISRRLNMTREGPVTRAEQISLSWGGTIAAIQGENDSFMHKPRLGLVSRSCAQIRAEVMCKLPSTVLNGGMC